MRTQFLQKPQKIRLIAMSLSDNTMAEVWGAPPHTLLLRHVHMLQVLGAQLQSLCEKRSFVAQLKTDLKKPQILMTTENLIALILYMYLLHLPFF
jgi:hypothetical protein